MDHLPESILTNWICASFGEWVKQESSRAAESWLVGMPYAQIIVLKEPPGANGGLNLYRFASVEVDATQPPGHRGRPFGSAIFPDRDSFMTGIRLAVAVISGRGNTVTAEKVAELLVQKGLLGADSPISQLRRWTRDFGYPSWKALLNSL